MYKIRTKVQDLEEKTRVVRADKNTVTGEVTFTSESIGWFVHFEGSRESLFVGIERPTDLDVGTEVFITIIPIKPRKYT